VRPDGHGQRDDDRCPAIEVINAPYEHDEARQLLWAPHAEQVGLHGFADHPDELQPAVFEPPRGQFFLARLDGRAIRCGGWHLLAPAEAEIKRMYVTPAARGRGAERRILQETDELRAAGHGVTRMLLETGVRNAAALALYRSCGYEPHPPYVPGRSEVNRAMTKTLLTPVHTTRLPGASGCVAET
jgi:GNAT superfamily N-acetyltransferase